MITKNDDTSWHCCFYKLAYCIACNSHSLFYLAAVFNFLLVAGYVFVKCCIAGIVWLAFPLAVTELRRRLPLGGFRVEADSAWLCPAGPAAAPANPCATQSLMFSVVINQCLVLLGLGSDLSNQKRVLDNPFSSLG